MERHAQAGRIDWIGLRTERKGAVQIVDSAEVDAAGLIGDRHPSPGKRAVTMIQAEHLPVIAALSGHDQIVPELLRRNIVVSGLNLNALRKNAVTIGTAVIRITGPCAPCSRMEKLIGFGGYNAMRGHGGWTAEVIAPGHVAVGARVWPHNTAP
ncbi:MAG: MOSC domain-containing protein [Pikeienuella sp.]